ncbi:alpha/beta fold hydrolase [Enterovirga sp.]|jgi:3-oxoadipate enol-lactonase|uniref:alpha/beta fold hydrolase n=1 Tax=Enterovirga sp. TaxID=2026350 RepID=UPI00260A8101|nr:alpha/beta fold hydrolase [Enterovirga sp.]MDB5592648.1 alpha/beta hydrolase fold protein [Enterovirga sp.]
MLHHRLDGSGPPLVLLHPIGLDLTCWDGVVPSLAARFTVLRLDLPGHGGSPLPGPDHTLADYAQDVAECLRDVVPGPAAVLGLSFGGMIAQTLAIHHPGLVAALIPCGCPSEFPAAARAAIAERGAAAERGGMAAVLDATMERWFTPGFMNAPEAARVRQVLLADDPRGWAIGWRAISRLDTSGGLGAVTAPTCCIAGSADAAVPPDATRRIAGHIPQARFVELPGAPHMMHLEQPRAFSDAVLDFLK